MNKVKIRILDRGNSLKDLYKLDVNIYDIEYNKDNEIYTVAYDSLDKIPYDVEIVSYQGIPRIVLKVKKNLHFIISIIISFLIIILLSNICFSVTIVHSNKDVRTLVEDELYDLGLKPFTFKKTYNQLQDIKKKLKKAYPDNIEWLEIVDEGMRYKVRVEERIITVPKQESDYCNIISTRDATVLSTVSDSGQIIVNANDFVKKGDVLIQGEIKFNDEIKSHTCANGIVYGNTWYRVTTSIPLDYEEKQYTGKSKYNIGFEFGSTYNRIFKVHYSNYDVSKKRIFKIGRFALYTEKISEYNNIKKKYSVDDAIKEAQKHSHDKLQTNLGSDATILEEKVLQTDNYDSIISVEIFYSVKEIISEKVESEYKEVKEELE